MMIWFFVVIMSIQCMSLGWATFSQIKRFIHCGIFDMSPNHSSAKLILFGTMRSDKNMFPFNLFDFSFVTGTTLYSMTNMNIVTNFEGFIHRFLINMMFIHFFNGSKHTFRFFWFSRKFSSTFFDIAN